MKKKLIDEIEQILEDLSVSAEPEYDSEPITASIAKYKLLLLVLDQLYDIVDVELASENSYRIKLT